MAAGGTSEHLGQGASQLERNFGGNGVFIGDAADAIGTE